MSRCLDEFAHNFQPFCFSVGRFVAPDASVLPYPFWHVNFSIAERKALRHAGAHRMCINQRQLSGNIAQKFSHRTDHFLRFLVVRHVTAIFHEQHTRLPTGIF